MKALTVLQPWAWAILHGPKRIENRTWPTNYRGPLLIHAGKSRARLGDYGDGEPAEEDLIFGAVLGLVDLVDCRRLQDLSDGWRGHPFAEGPWCWQLANPRPFAAAISCPGAQALWTPPPKILAALPPLTTHHSPLTNLTKSPAPAPPPPAPDLSTQTPP